MKTVGLDWLVCLIHFVCLVRLVYFVYLDFLHNDSG